MTRTPLAEVRQRIENATSHWAGMTLAEIRCDFDALATAVEPSIGSFLLDGMPAQWFGGGPTPDVDRAVLYFHGGGFQIGSLRSHHGLMSAIASASSFPVLGFEYRLAPENRYPAAHQDSLKAYAALCALMGNGARIALAGDSAGGNLALATAVAARRSGLPAPSCLVLISPWLDLSMSGDSYRSRAELDFFSKPNQLRAMAKTYLGRDRDPSQPSCSSVFDDLSGLPPVLVHAGDHDITLDDATALEARANAAGTPVQLKVWAGMFHHFQMFQELPEAQESMADIASFLKAQLGPEGSPS